MKIANSNPAGPFGGVIAFQIAGNGTAAAAQNTPKRDVLVREAVDEELDIADGDDE